jgi:hypothetical protein
VPDRRRVFAQKQPSTPLESHPPRCPADGVSAKVRLRSLSAVPTAAGSPSQRIRSSSLVAARSRVFTRATSTAPIPVWIARAEPRRATQGARGLRELQTIHRGKKRLGSDLDNLRKQPPRAGSRDQWIVNLVGIRMDWRWQNAQMHRALGLQYCFGHVPLNRRYGRSQPCSKRSTPARNPWKCEGLSA